MPKRLLEGIAPTGLVTTRKLAFESGAIRIGGGGGGESEYQIGRLDGRCRHLTVSSKLLT